MGLRNLLGGGRSTGLDLDLDLHGIARWAGSVYGAEAVPISRRRAAENLMADEPEAAETWKQVADVANHYLCGRHLH